MVSDAERFRDEDTKVKERVEAKNALENYCFQMKNSLKDEQLALKFTEDDKKVIEDSTTSTLHWLEQNPQVEIESIKQKQKELEEKMNPIMVRVYQTAPPPQGGPYPQGGQQPTDGQQRGSQPSSGGAGHQPDQATTDDLD